MEKQVTDPYVTVLELHVWTPVLPSFHLIPAVIGPVETNEERGSKALGECLHERELVLQVSEPLSGVGLAHEVVAMPWPDQGDGEGRRLFGVSHSQPPPPQESADRNDPVIQEGGQTHVR